MHTSEKELLVRAVGVVVAERVAEAVAGLSDRLAALESREVPRGEKGDRGDPGENGSPGERGADGASGSDGKPGHDGIDGKDGAPGERGAEGPEGKPGRDGRDGLPGVQGEKGIDGRDGSNGKDGRDGIDGLGVDDLEVEFDGERKFTFRWSRGDLVVERTFFAPNMIYRGVWKDGTEYLRGDTVTFGGSMFVAQADTSGKPETPDSSWVLATKRGRDGRDGKLIVEKPSGPVKLG